MKKTNKVIQITGAKYLKKYTLEITFSDHKTQVIDFELFLKRSTHPDIVKYQNINKFKKYQIQDGELMWGDFEMIFPIMDLYNNKIQKEKDRKTQRTG